MVGWSHVYLGRILDMKEDREAALEEYRAALNAGGLPEIKAAAERVCNRRMSLRRRRSSTSTCGLAI